MHQWQSPDSSHSACVLAWQLPGWGVGVGVGGVKVGVGVGGGGGVGGVGPELTLG